MSEFIRLPNRIVNLATTAWIEFEDELVILHYPGQVKLILNAEETAVLLPRLEEHGLMSAPAARLAEYHTWLGWNE